MRRQNMTSNGICEKMNLWGTTLDNESGQQDIARLDVTRHDHRTFLPLCQKCGSEGVEAPKCAKNVFRAFKVSARPSLNRAKRNLPNIERGADDARN